MCCLNECRLRSQFLGSPLFLSFSRDVKKYKINHLIKNLEGGNIWAVCGFWLECLLSLRQVGYVVKGHRCVF